MEPSAHPNWRIRLPVPSVALFSTIISTCEYFSVRKTSPPRNISRYAIVFISIFAWLESSMQRELLVRADHFRSTHTQQQLRN